MVRQKNFPTAAWHLSFQKIHRHHGRKLRVHGADEKIGLVLIFDFIDFRISDVLNGGDHFCAFIVHNLFEFFAIHVEYASVKISILLLGHFNDVGFKAVHGSRYRREKRDGKNDTDDGHKSSGPVFHQVLQRDFIQDIHLRITSSFVIFPSSMEMMRLA